MGETIVNLNRLFSRRREEAWWWGKKVSFWSVVVTVLAGFTIVYLVMKVQQVMTDGEKRP
ncbi:hypothetical protein CMI37_30585 [Candidatus Pacearchaeota archaeon]|nr:hypothetical protein [Candidatus Pacearchaeota archaeon]|tara:strand:- start:348 stop:527 length:180 start_codon:yes stop_codon:yes gene_type:complete